MAWIALMALGLSLTCLCLVQRGHAAPVAAAQYVGAASCAGCHAAEAEAWQPSHHAMAMQPAGPDTVLGRFDQTRFSENGITSVFFRKDGSYFVRTDGPDGRLADFQIAYTFGVYPLQQYLVPFPDGRLQALSIAWDARPAAQGGQRWFHLYAGQHIDHRDPLHWTRPQQNWNSMCAGCHSTGLDRNYDAQRNRYASTWSDIAVGCEACHGAGSRHVAWAQHDPAASRLPDRGLQIVLDDRHGVQWRRDAAGGIAHRSTPLASHREIDTCAVCHARRSDLGAATGPTGALLDTHDPALLQAGLYFPDGQQQAEVYVYGSFLQSRMYAQGVSCSDCHEPHSLKLRAPGNAVCAQCHAPAAYDTPAHHLHAAGSTGAQCVSCHMPARTYMTVDPRRDHSLRVPRPDLSLQYGVPNACNGCHRDKSARWAAAVIEKAHGPQRKGYQHFVDALASARQGAPGAAGKLMALAADPGAPGIARATAVAALSDYAGPATLPAVRQALADADPLLRAAALETLLAFPPQLRAPLALPLADDAARAVRLNAGRILATVPASLLSPQQQAQRDRAFAAYVQSQQELADRPESHFNLGSIDSERGDSGRAIQEFRTALRLDPAFVPAYANWADLCRAGGDEDQAAAVLAEGLRQLPGNALLLHLSGLQRVRAGDTAAALPLLQRAAAAAPDHPHYAYVYAVALHAYGKPDQALQVLEQALRRSPYSPELLSGAAAFEHQAGREKRAQAYRRRYSELALPGTAAPSSGDRTADLN